MGKVIFDSAGKLWENRTFQDQVFFTYSGFELTYCDLGNMIHFSFFMVQFFLSNLKIVMPKHNIKMKNNFLVDFNHREKLYFTEFSRRICWNRSLVASSLFFFFTQSNKFDKFHWHILRKRLFIKLTEWKMVAPFSKFYDKIWVGFSLNVGKLFSLVISF